MASRKNHTLKLAGILLALVLVTSCFVGGTFAKYVTSGTGSDSARVAKFGVTVTANGTMFAKEYDTGTENVKGTIAKSVVSDGTDDKNLVAPGTSGNMVSMTLAGKPEVAVNVRYRATVTLSNNWLYKEKEESAGEFYCPITIKVGTKDGTEIFCGLDYNSAELFKSAVETAINNKSANYAPNTDLNLKNADALSVSWAWTFENVGEHKKGQDDVKDTYLGDQAAKGNAATIALEVVTTVTQID